MFQLHNRLQRVQSLIISKSFSISTMQVKVSQGIIAGKEEKLPNGNPFHIFSGVPYAKPPINELRFKSPQKLLKFDVPVLDCTEERDCCPHSFLSGFVGDENCLFLNIYAPKVGKPSGKALPVMVFIHGGGFTMDSSSRDCYSPEYLLQKDVIVVTFNYRLHVLGFLSLPSMGISGNAGLKDQQMAIEWVHENISSFNGDPENITIFGESAGAASVHLQILNKTSRHLIKRGILQSGTAIGDWVMQNNPEDKARILAKFLGCKGQKDQDVYETLMKATPKELLINSLKAIHPDEKRRNLPLVFKPVIEHESPDAFMTKSPLELIKSEKLDIPLMIGITDKDGMAMVSNARKKLELFDNDMSRMIPMSVNINPVGENAEKLGEEIKAFYFGDRGVNNNTISEFVDLMTDFHFLIPQTITNEITARYQPGCKQFLYAFGFDGNLNLFKKLLGMDDGPGACHVDDLCHLFDYKMFDVQVAEDSREAKMRDVMCSLWTNFAKYGDPTPEIDNPLPIKWTPVVSVNKDDKKIDLDYLIINETSRMVKNLNKERMDFWRNVYKTWNEHFLAPKL